MQFTSTLLLALSAAAGVVAHPNPAALLEYREAISPNPAAVLSKRLTTSTTGTNNGYYYSFWTNGGGTVDYENGNAGEYSVTWTNCGDFTSGKGWSTGSNR
jgi:endo-1,4-beta-xylanase